MKQKILLFACTAVFAFFNGQAQISRGSIFLGGQIGFNSQSTSNTTPNFGNQKNTSFNFSPAVGKAIKDNTVVGVDLDYEYYKNNPGDNSANQTTNVFGAGVFMRRYVPIGKGFYVFGQGRFGGSYTSGNADSSQFVNNGSYDVKGYSLGFGFYPGISYQVSKRLQLETGFNNLAHINYQHTKFYQPDSGGNLQEVKSSSFSVGASFNNLASFNLGFRVLLSR